MGTLLSLSQQLKLQVKLSPSQIQLMKMLEIPSCELQARINEELQNNPALEEGEALPSTVEESQTEDSSYEEPYEEAYVNPLQNDDFNYDDYVSDDVPDYPSNAPSDAVRAEEIPFSVAAGLQDHLKAQIYLTQMDKPDRHIAKFVVGNIDEDGYLRRTPEELVDDLAFREGITVSESKMKDIIRQVQTFDPSGVGAVDLQECLLLQLRAMPASAEVTTAIHIVQSSMVLLSRRDFDALRARYNLSEDQLRDIMQIITHLNPKPGTAYSNTFMERTEQIIIPDFEVENRDGHLVVMLFQGNIPELHIAPEYSAMLTQYNAQKASGTKNAESKEALRFVKSKIEAANTFISSIQQRNTTLMQTMQAIVEFQSEFFFTGDQDALRPMVLKDIADRTGLDVSTISRVSNSKYVQTEFGIYSLKFFFSELVTTKDGSELSNRAVKAALQDIIRSEDKSNPFTDDDLCDQLEKLQFTIARRTVAKYREALGFPVARLRRQM